MSPRAPYTVLIDGYNVIKRSPAWERLPLREARQRLIALLSRTRWAVPVSAIRVVFDTRDPDASRHQHASGVQVCFAFPSADAYIQETIRDSATPERLLIITDDGEILRTAKSHGVRWHATQWLIGPRPVPYGTGPRRAISGAAPRAEVEKPSLSAGDARKITEELAKRWLPKRSKRP